MNTVLRVDSTFGSQAPRQNGAVSAWQSPVPETLEGTGPRSTPLFYTGISHRPKRLTVQAAFSEETVLRFGPVGEKARQLLPCGFDTAQGQISWSLADEEIEADVVYHWRLETARQESGLSHEGHFWILSAREQILLEEKFALLHSQDESEFSVMAEARLLVRGRLYHEALLKIRKLQQGHPRPAQIAMAHTLQAMLYSEALRSLEKDAAAPLHFQTWMQNREQIQRRKAKSHVEAGTTLGRTSAVMPSMYQ